MTLICDAHRSVLKLHFIIGPKIEMPFMAPYVVFIY
jgi:hypothetical protein